MPSYLEIALRVVRLSQPIHPEPKLGTDVQTERVSNPTTRFPPDLPRNAQSVETELAECGSPECAGCYQVGDGNRIHPPRCSEQYRNWLERWKPRGKMQ
jgi:hypothetical protein